MRAPTGRSRSGCGRWKPRDWRCTATRNGSPIRSPRLPARRTRSRWPGPRQTRWCCSFRRCDCGSFRAGNATQPPVLVCAPYALHGALIADFAPGHSLVEALQKDGVNRIYVPDWRSAVPDMRYLSIDNYLAELNVAIDEIGAPVDLVGLCQGGWLSLVYAARFPGKVRRLVLAGAPVDVSTPSELSKMVAAVPQAAFEQMVQQGDGLVSGEHMLKLWNIPFNQHDVEAVLQRNLGDGSDEAQHAAGSFRALGPCDAGSAGDLLSRGDRPGFPAEPDRQKAASSRSAAGSISPRCACRSSCWRERTTSSSRAIRRSPPHRCWARGRRGWNGPASRAVTSAFSWGAAP